MAKLNFKTRQELEQYLQQNPQVQGSITDSGGQSFDLPAMDAAAAQPPQEQNWLQSMLGGIINPVVGTVKKGGEFLNAASEGLQGRSGVGDWIAGTGNYKPIIQSQDEYQKFVKNPGLDTVKDLAGVAALFPPARLGLLASGALSGGLSSFANSDATDWNEIDPTKIGADALLGGAVGGGLGLASKGISKLLGGKNALTNAADALEGQNLGIKFDKNTPVQFTQGNVKSAVDQLKATGKTVSPQSLDNLATQNTEEFRNLLQNQYAAKPAALGTANIQDDLQKTLFDKFSLGSDELAASPALQAKLNTITKKIEATGGDPAKLFDLTNELTTVKGLDADITTAASNKIVEAARQYARDKIKEVVPEAGSYFSTQAPLRDVAANARTSLNSADKVNIPIIGSYNIPGAGAATNKARSGIASLLRGAGNVSEGIRGMIPNQLNAKNLTRFGVPAMTGMSPSGQPLDQSEAYGVSPSTDQTGLGSFEATPTQQYEQVLNEIANAVSMPKDAGGMGLSPDNAVKQAKMLLMSRGINPPQGYKEGAGAKQTEKQRTLLGGAKMAAQALDSIKSGKAGSGKVPTAINSFKEYFGINDPNQTRLASNFTSAVAGIRNAISGATVTDAEKAFLSGMLPEITDEPSVAIPKLEELIRTMKAYAGQEIN